MMFASIWSLFNLAIVFLFLGGFVFILVKLNSIDKSLKELVRVLDK